MYRLPPAILALLVFAFSAPALVGQSSVINKTDLGKSQNTAADLANSLDPTPPKYGKGEKGTEIDPKKLENYGITQAEMFTAIANNNRLVAAGSLDTGKGDFSIKVPSVIAR